LHDRLAEELGQGRVFKDVDSVRPGQDFMSVVNDALANCRVLLAVIGPEWLSAGNERGRRIDDPADLVRLEIEAALAREDVLVVPVLVGGATVPAAKDLPPSLAPLATRQATELRPTNFDNDAVVLMEAVRDRLGWHGQRAPSDSRESSTVTGAAGEPRLDGRLSGLGTWRRLTLAAVGLTTVGAGALLVAWFGGGGRDHPSPSSVPTPAPNAELVGTAPPTAAPSTTSTASSLVLVLRITSQVIAPGRAVLGGTCDICSGLYVLVTPVPAGSPSGAGAVRPSMASAAGTETPIIDIDATGHWSVTVLLPDGPVQLLAVRLPAPAAAPPASGAYPNEPPVTTMPPSPPNTGPPGPAASTTSPVTTVVVAVDAPAPTTIPAGLVGLGAADPAIVARSNLITVNP
jgi:hypothetical protein